MDNITDIVDKIIKNRQLRSELAYRNILEWLYVNDGKFPNKNQWREEFVKVLEFNILGKTSENDAIKRD